MKSIAILITIIFICATSNCKAQFDETLTLFKAIPAPSLNEKKEKFIYNKVISNPTTLKTEFISINLNALANQHLRFYLFKEVLETDSIRIERRGIKNYSAFIKLKNIEGHIILTIFDNDILGSILIDKQYYEIKTIGDGKYLLRMFDQKKYPSEGCLQKKIIDVAYDNKSKKIKVEENVKPKEIVESKDTDIIKCNLRILVMYTLGVDAAVNNAKSLCQQAIDLTNQTYVNSGITQKTELAYAGVTNYSSSGDVTQDLDRFKTDGDGSIDEVFQIREATSSDLCVLLTEANNVCGIADAIYADNSHVFCAVNNDCAVNSISFPHEIGHLLGARHDTLHDNSTTPFSDGHGYFDFDNQFRTIMGVQNSCCVRIPNWSNPDVSRNGAVTGDNATSNNTRVLNLTITDAITFRQPPPQTYQYQILRYQMVM